MSQAPCRSRWTIAAALAVVFVAAPGTVDAGCFHDALARQLPPEVAEGLGLRLIEAGPDFVPFEVPSGPSAPSRPCTGAFCTGLPAVPFVPGLSIPPSLDHWGLLEALG